MEAQTKSQHRIAIEPELYRKLEETAKNKNMTTQEYADFLFQSATVFEYKTVKVQVRKQLLQLIEEAKYFGRTPVKFFADCIIAGTDVSVNDSDFDEMQRLQKKYKTEKLHLLEVYPDKTSL